MLLEQGGKLLISRRQQPLEPVASAAEGADRADVMKQCVRANVEAGVRSLQQDSENLVRLIREDGLQFIGAEYSLETGAVHFFEGTGDNG